jgi:undecaprenyl-diphosphatase
MSMLHTIILSIVEGLTEFLPVSSTGHMIIVSWFLGINEVEFVKDFTVIVQFGAILSVLVLYWRRFLVGYPFYLKLFIAFLPAAIIGLLVKKKIDVLLGDVRVVGWALVIGGVILLFIDRLFAEQEKRLEAEGSGHIANMTYVQALVVGFVQCLAFVPGVSRSASSIIGALGMKLNRKAAAEFSFFLAVPTLTAATAYKCLKIAPTLTAAEIPVLLIGNLIAFIVGCLAIRTFVNFLTKHGFFVFGIYRIVVGAAILILIALGKGISDV